MSVAGRFMTAVILASLVAACDSSGERTQPPPVEDTAFGDTVDTMDKARAVESTLQQEKEERDRAINAAEAQ